jgi:hypothetical protein
MMNLIKKSIVSLMLISLLFCQTGCIELWSRYQQKTTLNYLATLLVTQYTALYSVAMISAFTQRSVQPGSSTPHSFVFAPPGDSLLTYQILVAFSTAFLFNTFGNTGDTVGEYRIVDPNGVLIRTALIIAITSTLAYIDLNNSGNYETEYEPTVAYQGSNQNNEQQTFLINFPHWAGGQSGIAAYALTDFAIFTFLAGILTNPTSPGLYTTTFNFTSIDPDSGLEDDSSGDPPATATATTQLIVALNIVPILYILLMS